MNSAISRLHRALPPLLRTFAAFVAAGVSRGVAVEMEFVTVGDAGNPPEPNNIYSIPNLGVVSSVFQIGKYEVTNVQYAEFLNAKAASDPYALYDGRMEADALRGGIVRTGASGSYTYAVKPGFEAKPVVFVSFYDALRFANWMHNGQGSADTEAGAYTLTPNPSNPPNPANGTTVVREPGATVFLPNENEWYKAAYYQRDGTYRIYPMRTNSTPVAAAPPGGPNTANFGGVISGGSVTPVGAYPQCAGPYGTFDQGGNALEWLETVLSEFRALRGGHFNNGSDALGTFSRGYGFPNESYEHSGFRIASSVPPPAIAAPPRGLGKIMPLGDSLTQSQNNLFSYRYYLWKRLLDQGVAFDFVGSLLDNGIGGFPPWPPHLGLSFDQNHEGRSGKRTDEIRDLVLGWSVGYVPDVVLLLAGTNDALVGRSAPLVVADLREIIVRLRTKNAQASFYVGKLPPVAASVTWQGVPVNQYIDAINALIPSLTSDPALSGARVTIVDLHTGFDFATEGLADGIHPNAAGEEKIAARFFEALQLPVLNCLNGVDGNGQLTVTFLRIQQPFQLAYAVEVSTDLQQWFSGLAHTELVTAQDHFNGTETVTIRDRTSPLTADRRFIRLKLSY